MSTFETLSVIGLFFGVIIALIALLKKSRRTSQTQRQKMKVNGNAKVEQSQSQSQNDG